MKLSPEEIEAQLAAIRQDYLASLTDRRNNIVDYCESLRTSWDQETYNALYRLLHSLAGSAETFGLNDVTAQARHLLNQLKQRDQDKALGSDTIHGLKPEIDRLLGTINASLQGDSAS